MLKAHGQDLRKGRYSQPGQIYMVTAVTRNRKPFFAGFNNARWVIKALHGQSHHAATLAYVVMPDHVHWLMQLTGTRGLSSVVRCVKAASSHYIGEPVWQRGFHDHALRKQEDIKALARYIVANPLRAGLVSCVGDYPHWDAIWL